jgi:hypothetical protein
VRFPGGEFRPPEVAVGKPALKEAQLTRDLDCWVPSDAVIYAEMGDGVALLDARTNVYYALSGIGPFLWQKLVEDADLAGLCAATTDAFEIDPSTARRDIEEWLQTMAAAGLIRRSND